MNANTANLINSIALIAMGSWGAYETALASKTALIPVVGGIILLLCYNGIKKENKVIAHVAVVLTLLLIIGIIRPFTGALDDGDSMGTLRTGVMILTGIIALVYFIKSFRDARKAREGSS